MLITNRFPSPKISNKRPSSFNDSKGLGKKARLNDNAVEPFIFGGQSLVIKEEGGELYVSNTRSTPPPTSDFFSDSRLKKSAILLPSSKNFPYFDKLKNLSLSCSFFGNNCTSCNYLNGNHSIVKNNIFLLGDHFTPPCMGSHKECVPTVIIKDPSFESLKETLLAQKKNGMGNSVGRVALVCLLSLLIKVGATEYFLQLSEFSQWAKSELSLTIIPFICPFPTGLPDHALISIQQFLSILQAKYLGDFMGAINDHFSMWKPFYKACNDLKMEKKQLPVPPITFKTEHKNLTIDCKSDVFIGSAQKLTSIESVFYPFLFDQLALISPPSSPLTVPSSDALRSGFSGGADIPSRTGPQLFLMGSSILGGCVGAVTESAQISGFNVVNLCKGGDLLKNIKFMNLPQSENVNDTLVLLFLGNNIFRKSSHYKEKGVWHMINPQLLNDTEINELIKVLRELYTKLRVGFKGKIKLLGPFPRFASPCCPSPSHSIPLSFPFTSTTDYILHLNKFLALHPSLRFQNFEFIPPNAIFGQTLPVPFTHDRVHLTPSASNTLSSFLKNIIVKKTCVLPTCDPKDCSSFFQWATDLKKIPTVFKPTSSNDGQSVSLPPSHDEPSPSILDESGGSDMEEESIDLASALALLDMSFED